MHFHCFHCAIIHGYLWFSLSGKNTLHLKSAAHSHVVTWETKSETITKTKHSINTLRVVPSLHSKWPFTLLRLSYAESKNSKFYGLQKFWCGPKPPGVAGGWKNCRSVMALLLLGGCCCKQGQQQKNEWQHVLTAAGFSKFGTPILRLWDTGKIEQT